MPLFYNQDIGDWDVSNVTSIRECLKMLMCLIKILQTDWTPHQFQIYTCLWLLRFNQAFNQ